MMCGHPRVELCLARGGGGGLARVGPVPILVEGVFPDVMATFSVKHPPGHSPLGYDDECVRAPPGQAVLGTGKWW